MTREAAHYPRSLLFTVQLAKWSASGLASRDRAVHDRLFRHPARGCGLLSSQEPGRRRLHSGTCSGCNRSMETACLFFRQVIQSHSNGWRVALG